MFRFLIATLIIPIFIIITEVYCDDEDNMIFKYDGMERPESVEKFFKIEVSEMKNKEGSTSIIIVNGEMEQLVVFDDDWKAEIIVDRSDTKDGDYTEYMKFPKVGLCHFMKTIYKKYFYPNLKDCANEPPPDTCPLPKEKYSLKCEFDAKVFRHITKPGFYIIKANLLKDDEIQTGVIVRGSVFEK